MCIRDRLSARCVWLWIRIFFPLPEHSERDIFAIRLFSSSQYNIHVSYNTKYRNERPERKRAGEFFYFKLNSHRRIRVHRQTNVCRANEELNRKTKANKILHLFTSCKLDKRKMRGKTKGRMLFHSRWFSRENPYTTTDISDGRKHAKNITAAGGTRTHISPSFAYLKNCK